MPLSPFPLPISYGLAKGVRSSAGYLINMEAEAAPVTARTTVRLNGSPGLKLFADTGTGEVLSMITANNVAYAVTRTGFYRVFENGGVFKLGTVDLLFRCAIATNGTHVVVTDGRKIFSYEIQSDEQDRYNNGTAFNDFMTELTNASNYNPSNTVTFLNQRFIFDRIETNQFYNTGLLDLTVNALAISSAEASPDYAVAVIQNQQQLWVIGAETFEVFYDSGVGFSPYQRVDAAGGDHGTRSPYSLKSFRNSVFWLDQNGSVIEAAGYVASPVSTPDIEAKITEQDLTTAVAFCYEEKGHHYYQLTVGTFTAVYDLSTGLWHQRKDRTESRHLANCHCFAYGKNLVGSYTDGKIYEMSRAYYDNAGDPMVAEIITGPDTTAGRMTGYPSIELEVQSGVGNVNIENPQIGMQISHDDGKTWGITRYRSIGATGEYMTRVRWMRNGQSRFRRHKFTISDPVQRSMTAQMWVETQ